MTISINDEFKTITEDYDLEVKFLIKKFTNNFFKI